MLILIIDNVQFLKNVFNKKKIMNKNTGLNFRYIEIE
jgi:hypothetical protein